MSVWFDGPKRGPWKVRYRDGERDPETGKLLKKYLGTYHTAIERDAAIADKTAELDEAKRQQRKATGGALPIAKVLDEWATHQLNIGKIQAPYALEVKGAMLALFAERKWSTLADATLDAVETWRGSRAGGVGVAKKLSMLKRLIRWASRAPLRQRVDLEVLLMERVARARRPEPDLLTDDEVRAAKAKAYEYGDGPGALVEHLAMFGCRAGEACRLIVRSWDAKARRIVHFKKAKNGEYISHPVPEEFGRTLDRITAGRGPSEPLYLSPDGEAWAVNARGKQQQVVDWYWSNVGDKVMRDPRKRGIGCLKDYAISVMDQLGIDDATKATFTAHLDLSVYGRHYKKTNAERAAAAAALMARRLKGEAVEPLPPLTAEAQPAAAGG